MGNDGGSIPTRRELVKEAARNPTTTEVKASQHEQQEYYWSTDPLSRKPLAQPIVSDCNGKLYNKDSIIEYLLPSDESKDEAESILQGSVKSLKDVVEVRFEIDTSAEAPSTSFKKEVWKCPVTGDTLGPGSKAVYLVPCGHAFSQTAVKEISGEKCLQCNEPYASNDAIPILSTSATDLSRLALRLKTLKEKGLSHSLKKAAKESKKRKKRHDKGEEEAPVPTLVPAVQKQNINNASTASLTAKVLQEQEIAKKRRMNDNVKALFSSRDQSKPLGKSSDFMTRGYDIPANAKR